MESRTQPQATINGTTNFHEPTNTLLQSEELTPTTTTDAAAVEKESSRWPGWPGDCVFRLIVPVMKVGSIIGRKGELIKKMCDETRARIRVLSAPVGTPDRIVLISGKEEPDVPVSPAMDATIRVFKRVSGLPEGDSQVSGSIAIAFCSMRMLVASTQAINLIGKQGSLIKAIQENSGALVRVLSEEEVPSYVATDERIVELQGESLKVLKALEAIVGHLRKFLVDHSVIPLFEKNYNATNLQADTMVGTSQGAIDIDFPLPVKRETSFPELETHLDLHLPPSRISLYGQDPSLPSALRSSLLARTNGPIVTQITQTMQVPISYAEEIIGIGGNNIAYIRRTSGAVITVEESRGLPDEITVEIKGTSTQVQLAQDLIQKFLSNHKEVTATGSFGKYDPSLRSLYDPLDSTALYPSTSLPGQPFISGYMPPSSSSGLGGYTSFRL